MGDPRIVLTALQMVPSSGGTVQSVRNFQRALDARVISFTDPDQLATEGSAIPDTLHVRTQAGRLGRFYSLPERGGLDAAEMLLRSADLVSCHVLFRAHTHLVARQARRGRIPYWVVPHGCLDPYVFSYRGATKRIWMHIWGRRFLSGAARVIFSTERERQKAAVWHRGANTCVIPWPVPQIDLNPAEAERQRTLIRAEWGAAPDDRVLLALGRLHPMKCLDKLVASFAAARPARAHLVIVGPEEGVTRAELQAQAARCGVDRIHLLGPVYGERKTLLLAASDGLVSLSRRENFGYGVAEAMELRLPVILSPGNDLGYELRDRGCGWILGDESVATAGRAIAAWAAADPKTLLACGAAGQRFTRERLSFETFSTALRRLAAETVAGSRQST